MKNLPCNAGNTGSIPGQRTKMAHTKEQLNLQAAARESEGLNKRLHVVLQ